MTTLEYSIQGGRIKYMSVDLARRIDIYCNEQKEKKETGKGIT